jgi:hypothetical protein
MLEGRWADKSTAHARTCDAPLGIACVTTEEVLLSMLILAVKALRSASSLSHPHCGGLKVSNGSTWLG